MSNTAKFLTAAFVCAFATLAVLAGAVPAVSVEEALQPYQQAVEELNAELGAAITLEYPNLAFKTLVLKGKPVDVFKAELRDTYLEALNSPKDIIIDDKTINNPINKIFINSELLRPAYEPRIIISVLEKPI